MTIRALVGYGLLCWTTVLSAERAAQAAQLRFQVVEAKSGNPAPCRIHLKDAAGKPVRPPDLPFWHDHFVCGGSAELTVPAGAYTYEIERGPEYHVISGKVEPTDAAPQTIAAGLARLTRVADEGWWSGDLHVHRPLPDVELLIRAEDLHVAPVITWWNNRNPWRDQPVPEAALRRFDSNRWYHALGGEDERGGGALLYFNLDRPLEIAGAGREHPSPMHFLAQARRQPNVWIDVEKPFWLDAPVWLASGMIDSLGIAHNHMHRGGVLPNEAWGKARDKNRYPDPQGNGFWTQDIYYHALNCGLRVPPSAGSASGVLPNPVGHDRVYVQLEGELTYAKWWEGLKAGRVFVSNGPLLRCQANGKWPGHVFRAAAGDKVDIQLDVKLDSRDPVRELELVKDGKVMQRVPVTQKTSGTLGRLAFHESGWFLARVIADVPGVFRFASTAPFYVEIGDKPHRISRASAQFFVDWVRERMGNIALDDPAQREEVLKHHRDAERFWMEKVQEATAE